MNKELNNKIEIILEILFQEDSSFEEDTLTMLKKEINSLYSCDFLDDFCEGANPVYFIEIYKYIENYLKEREEYNNINDLIFAVIWFADVLKHRDLSQLTDDNFKYIEDFLNHWIELPVENDKKNAYMIYTKWLLDLFYDIWEYRLNLPILEWIKHKIENIEYIFKTKIQEYLENWWYEKVKLLDIEVLIKTYKLLPENDFEEIDDEIRKMENFIQNKYLNFIKEI